MMIKAMTKIMLTNHNNGGDYSYIVCSRVLSVVGAVIIVMMVMVMVMLTTNYNGDDYNDGEDDYRSSIVCKQVLSKL